MAAAAKKKTTTSWWTEMHDLLKNSVILVLGYEYGAFAVKTGGTLTHHHDDDKNGVAARSSIGRMMGAVETFTPTEL